MKTGSPACPDTAKPLGGRLPGLDALRGIAALCVLYLHAAAIFEGPPVLQGKGYLAVDFFFMLSGYVMTRTYEHRLADGYGAARFMKVRLRRLWPVMTIGALIGAPIAAMALDDPALFLVVLVANLAFIPTFVGNQLFPVNAVAWSIFAELCANLAHGLLLWRWRTKTLLLALLLLLPVLAGIGLSHGSLAVGLDPPTLLGGLARAAFAYGAGIVLFRCWRDRPPFRIAPLAALLAMPALLTSANPLTASWLFDLGFVVAVCPLLIAGGLSFASDRPVWHWLGAMSFPLYAVNLPLLLWSKALGLGAAAGIGTVLAASLLITLRTNLGPVTPRQPARA